MKNLFLTLLCLVVLGGCTSTKGWYRPLTFTSTLTEGGSEEFEAQIVGLESIRGFTFGGPTGLDLSVQNNTGQKMRIEWNKSSINHKDLFLSRMRYIDLKQQIPPQPIEPGETATRAIYLADNVLPSVDNGWTVTPFEESELTLLLCLNWNNKDHFVVFKVTLAAPEKS